MSAPINSVEYWDQKRRRFESLEDIARELAEELRLYHEMPDHSARNCEGSDCETHQLLRKAAGLLPEKSG